MLVYYKVDIINSSSNVTCSHHNIAANIAYLALNNNHLITVWFRISKLKIQLDLNFKVLD
jgi:hypothetical protein